MTQILGTIVGWMVLPTIYLMGRKTIWGPICGIVTQLCWIVYTLYTRQYGMFSASALLALIYVWALCRWSREAKEK